MTQQTGDDLQSTKLGEYLLLELKMVHNALATDLLAHLAFEEEALGPTILKLEEWPL